MTTYTVVFSSNVGMFVHHYATKTVNAENQNLARLWAESWAAVQPERDNVVVERVEQVA